MCKLISKQPQEFKFRFKCNDKDISIECEKKRKNGCELEVRDKLSSYSFKISNDEWESFKIFELDTLNKVNCESKFKICNYRTEDCENYKGILEFTSKKEISSFLKPDRCDHFGLNEIRKIGGVTTNYNSNIDFQKVNCEKNPGEALEALSSKLTIIGRNMLTPIANSDNLLNICLEFDSEADEKEFFHSESYKNIQENFLRKIKDTVWLRSLLCEPKMEKLYTNEKLDADRVTCLIFEDFKISDSKSKYAFACRSDDQKSTGVAFSGRARKGAFGLAGLAKAQTLPPGEQQPLTGAMAEQLNKPLGVVPALSQVEKMVPNGFNAGGASEGAVASGAVRGIPSADVATRAGEIFAPVFSKIDSMARSVQGLGSNRSRSAPVGSASLASSKPRLTSSGSRLPSTTTINGSSTKSFDSEIQLEDDSASAAATGPQKIVPGVDAKAPIRTLANQPRRSDTSNGDAPAVRRTGNNLETLNSSSGRVATGTKGKVADTADGGISEIVQAREQIDQLGNRSPEQIKTFFTQESKNIPGFRELIYDDPEIKKTLERLRVRVVGANSRETGSKLEEAVLLLSDNGKTFIPLPIRRKEKK